MNFAHGTSHHLKANDLNNPALPPKLHKSLTNLKSTTTATSSSSSLSATAAVNTNNISNSNQRKNNNNNNNDNTTTASKTNNTNNSNTTSTTTNCNNFSSTSSSTSNTNSNAILTMHNTPPLASTTSVQTIYTLSKPHQHSILTPNSGGVGGGVGIGSNINNLSPSFNANRKSEHDHIMKITQQQPPSLTLPLATTSTITSFTSSTSKINSSTFYPLQNNVTYTLPKNIGGKMSLNSTINSVVSKVPSVISLPSSSSISTSIANEHLNLNNVSSEVGDNHHHVYHHSALNYQHQSAAAGLQQGSEGSAITSKSTTLPKILRTKRDLHSQNHHSNNSNTTNNHNSSSHHTSNNLNTSSTANNAAASMNYAVSQCFMPAYPKQYITSNNTTSSSSSTSTTSATTAAIQQQQQQQQPTNINNMQTQTITSTLAANYCPEDSHFNQHYFTTNATPTTHSTFASTFCSPSASSNNIITTTNTTTTITSTTTNTTNTTTGSNNAKQLPVCTTSKNCLNPKEHFLPNDTSLDDDYLSECENCKIAQSSKYYLDAEALASGPQATMTLQRKSMEECKEETETGYYRISHTLPTNSKKNA